MYKGLLVAGILMVTGCGQQQVQQTVDVINALCDVNGALVKVNVGNETSKVTMSQVEKICAEKGGVVAAISAANGK